MHDLALCVCVYVCVCARARVYLRVCLRACVPVLCVCVCVCSTKDKTECHVTVPAVPAVDFRFRSTCVSRIISFFVWTELTHGFWVVSLLNNVFYVLPRRVFLRVPHSVELQPACHCQNERGSKRS